MSRPRSGLFLLFALISVGISLFGCGVQLGPSVIAASAITAPIPNYFLQWSDDFSGAALNTSTWNYRTDVKDFSAQIPANVAAVTPGMLNIQLRSQTFDRVEFTAGGIVSKANFKYGYYQVEMKTPPTPGWHTAFWMESGDGKGTYIPDAHTEIDAVEVDSESPTHISVGVNEWENTKLAYSQRCNAGYETGSKTSTDFHSYGMEWTETEITYYYDGKSTCSQSYPATEHIHDRVNIWLTSIGFGTTPPTATPQSIASFKNVAYFARDYYVDQGETGYAEYGSGWAGSQVPGFSHLPTRQSCIAGSFASWTPTILQSGNYDVQIYVPVTPTGDTHAQLHVISNIGSASKTIDYSAGASGWVDLGTFLFSAGSSGYVVNTNSGSGCTLASTVKFMRQ